VKITISPVLLSGKHGSSATRYTTYDWPRSVKSTSRKSWHRP